MSGVEEEDGQRCLLGSDHHGMKMRVVCFVSLGEEGVVVDGLTVDCPKVGSTSPGDLRG